jgi:sugar/nucleoside kinase (ribokinase family)
MGVPVRILAKCAEADRALLRPLTELGLPVMWLPAASTAAFSISYDGERREMTVEALGEPWTPAEAELVGDADWVHVAPLARSDFPLETLAALARGRQLSFDGQGLVRPARTGPLELDADFEPAVLEHVRILKLAEEEAETIGQVDVPELVITLGSRGALVQGVHVPAAAIAATDPTGAGDAFAAAYLASRAAGEEPLGAARRAAEVVAEVLR